MSARTQADRFHSGEGDNWYLRNRETDTKDAPVRRLIKDAVSGLPFTPSRVLEIGCGGGQNLVLIKKMTGCEIFGIDPSVIAINDCLKQNPDMSFQVGSAENLPFADSSLDLVIFGFCLYLLDRSLLFKAAAEADRVLATNGALLIVDFSPPFPYRNKYIHQEGIFSFKMDYASMFACNPQYVVSKKIECSHTSTIFDTNPNERVGVTTLIKLPVDIAYPLEPFALTNP